MGIGRKLGSVLIGALVAQMVFVAPIQASTLGDIQNLEQTKQQEISKIEALVQKKLISVNEKKTEIEDLNNQIATVEEQKAQTLVEIEEQKAVIAARKAQLQERLVALQTSSSAQSRILMLMEADNFGDFINLFIIIGQLQGADNDRIATAIEEEQKLEGLEDRLSEEVAMIEDKSQRLDAESKVLAKELNGLQAVLHENRAELEQIMSDRAAEEKRLAEKEAADRLVREEAEAQKAAAAKAEAEKAASAKVANAASVPVEEVETVVSTPVQTVPVSSPAQKEEAASGRQVLVNATAYSRNQPSLSNHTFLGIDLRENPMVIAVDPAFIPLWSLVEVPGYGIYLAGDTGSDIVGNRIDIHMESLDSALAFGRRQMTLTVLN